MICPVRRANGLVCLLAASCLMAADFPLLIPYHLGCVPAFAALLHRRPIMAARPCRMLLATRAL